MFLRRQLLGMGVGTFFSTLMTKVLGQSAVAPATEPQQPAEVYTPRISWEYVPDIATRNDAEDNVVDIFRWSETVVIRLHRMPAGHYPGARFVYRTHTLTFIRSFAANEKHGERLSLQMVLDRLNAYKKIYPLTPDEIKCVQGLIDLITPGHEIDQKLPIPARQFVVQWTGSPPEPTA